MVGEEGVGAIDEFEGKLFVAGVAEDVKLDVEEDCKEADALVRELERKRKQEVR